MSERENVWLSNRVSCSLATLIYGDRNIDEIIDTIQQSLLQDPKSLQSATTFFQQVLNVSIQAQYALLQMQQKSYILQEDNSLASRLDIFCHHLNIAPTVAHQGLRSTKVAVKALGSVAAEDLIAVLESLQIQVADEGDWTTIPEKCPSLL